MFDRISKSLEETKEKFDNNITSNKDLEMNVKNSVWASDYKEEKKEVEEIYIAGLLLKLVW